MKQFQYFNNHLSASLLTKRVPSALGLAAVVIGLLPTLVQAQIPSISNLHISAVLDGYYQSEDRIMTERAEGFGVGETEFSLSADIDDMFFGKLTTVYESHSGEDEFEVEEAFIQTTALPNGFSVRAGRFLSNVGYLNNQHLHTDSFTSRPGAYRAFLGNHYFDNGLRVSYTAPTDLYWTMGAEAFSGTSLRAEDESGERDFDSTGVYTAFTKIGGDIGVESSWQLGLSYLRNENGQVMLEAHNEEEEAALAEEGDEHDAGYTGENTYIADFVFKWAPNGNYKYRSLTLSAEYFRVNDFMIDDLNDEIATAADEGNDGKDYHQAWYVSGVYQFSPHWSAGLRYGKLDTQLAGEEGFSAQTLKETELSASWHNSHFSTVRLEVSHQSNVGFDDVLNDNVVTLQYIMSLGDHGAHQF